MENCKRCHEPVLETSQNIRFLKADCLRVETVPNLMVGVLMLHLVSFAKSYKEKQLLEDVIWGLKCSKSFYCTSGAVVGMKQSGPDF